MRRGCKDVNLRDYKTLMPWVWDCIKRHYKRYDFRDMLVKEYRIPLSTYAIALENQDPSLLFPAVKPIAQEAVRRIANQDLEVRPPRIENKIDITTGKIRPIGCEEPMQQVFDTIAVYAASEVWKRRVISQQVSSIPNRGPLYGAKMIQHWVIEDNRAIRYASAHNITYISKCRYHVIIDATKCFPSARFEVFMVLFRRDCANEDLLWLFEALFRLHRVEGYEGFLIGSWISQQAMQYMLSFVYRHVMALANERRGKRIRFVTHMVTCMDDMLMTGTNRKNLKSAVRSAVKFAKSTLGLNIKPNWQIKELEKEPIDMMGYVIHRNGKMTIRARNLIHGRRLVLTYYREHALTLQQARRLSAYKGFFKHTKITHVKKRKKDDKRLQVKEAFDYAASVVSRYDREANNGTIQRKSTIQRTAGTGQVHAAPGREGGCMDQARHTTESGQRGRRCVVCQGSLFADDADPGGN